MRLIEKEMNTAIQNGRDWAKDNTRVECEAGFRCYWGYVYLHNHLIAAVMCRAGCDDIVRVNHDVLRKWPSRTTLSRLRALGVDVCTRKGEVILNGKTI